MSLPATSLRLVTHKPATYISVRLAPLGQRHSSRWRYRAMPSKASLKRAEDFVEFLNASPTRMIRPSTHRRVD